MISVIGIPLALILLGCFILGAYLTQIFVGMLLGRLLFEFFNKREANAYISLAVGLAAYHLLTLIPILGGVAALATVVLGLGTLFLLAKEALAKSPR
jgi:hypothetical protein